MKIQKLSLELELARRNAEKWEGTREERKSKFDSRSIVSLPLNLPGLPLTRVAGQDYSERLCSLEVDSEEAQ